MGDVHVEHQRFADRETFGSEAANYSLFPFRWGDAPGGGGRILVTSDAGEYCFIRHDDFEALQAGTLDRSIPAFGELVAKQIISDGPIATPLRLLATKIRTKKAFVREAQTFHVFVVTLRCDHSCHYCQVSRQTPDRSRFDMSSETAIRAVERMFETPAKTFTVEFQGGEPLLAFDRIKEIVELIAVRSKSEERPITFTMTSTLHHLTDEMLAFFKEHCFQISTSLDGPASLHNLNRPTPSNDAHEQTVGAIKRARNILGRDAISALTTLTSRSLEQPEEIVDEYVGQGFSTVFLRPLSPYGFALKSARKIGYTMADFIQFYERAFAHILSLNRQGVHIAEAYASILLTHILTPFSTGYVDLRSPAGAGLGTFVYNYDGGIYASDESRMLAAMGDETFRLGSVDSPYTSLMTSPAMEIIRAAGTAEELPVCRDCVFLPYCGADPVHAYATQGTPFGDRTTSTHCMRHMGLFKILFRYIEQADPEIMRIFLSWVMRKPATQLTHKWSV